MKPVTTPYSKFTTMRKYIFILVFLLVGISIMAYFNPGGVVTTYLHFTLPIIIFFMCFIIAMLYIYNRNPTDLTPINIPVNNWFFGFLVVIIELATLIGFIYWTTTSFGIKSYDEFKSNESGNRVPVCITIAIISLIFFVSLFSLANNQKFSPMNLAYLAIILFLIGFVYLISFVLIPFTGKVTLLNPTIVFSYLAICIVFIFMFNSSKDFTITTTNEQIMNSYFYKFIMFLTGAGASAGFIYWIVTAIGNLDSSSSIISLIINIAIVAIVLGLVYRSFSISSIFKSSPLVRLVLGILFYIPCLIFNIFEFANRGFTGASGLLPSFSLKQEYQNTTRVSVMMFVLAIVLFIIYFIYPYFLNANVLQGGKQLLNQPDSLKKTNVLGSYSSLNNSNQFKYKYAISFWFFIESTPNSNSCSFDKYVSILNYGGKPNVQYNSTTNALIITSQVGNKKDQDKDVKKTDRIIYKNENVLLQKWNNLIINYDGGSLDIFYNGELVKSVTEIMTYMNLDTLIAGQQCGVNGGICNVIYFNKPLTATQIFYVYNSVKDKTPPVLYDSNTTLLQNEFNKVSVGDEVINSNITSTAESVTIPKPDITKNPNI
jgi:hypothetical protein